MATAVADVSGLIEAASSPDPTPSTPVTITPEEVVSESPEGEVTETPESGEGAAKTAAAGDETKVDARNNPDAIRKALRALRDSDPVNAPIARQLNDIVGREKAFRDVFPKVSDAKQAKFLLDTIGGGEGLSQLQSTIKAVNDTDQLLYAGDAKVIQNLYEDAKAAGHPEALGKLASPFLEHLRDNDEPAYKAAIRPHLHSELVSAGFAEVLKAMDAAINAVQDGKPAPDLRVLTHNVAEMKNWFGWLDGEVQKGQKSALDPERQALAKERSEFQSEKQKAFQGEVHSEWNRVNNQVLGEALKPYLKLPFAKGWGDATKVSLAREITSTLMAELSADKAYQATMDGYWSEPKPDKAKILKFHKEKLGLIGPRIVKDVLDTRHPGFSSVKGAPVAAKPAGQAAPVTPAVKAGKPVFQATKPAMGDPIVDWDRTSNVLYATSRFYDKRGVLRSWNPKDK